MEKETNSNVDPVTAGYGIAAAVAIIFNTLLAWAKDSNASLLAAMKAAMGHHWTTHGVVVVAVFLVLGLILSRRNIRLQGMTLAKIISGSVILGGLGLLGWFFFA